MNEALGLFVPSEAVTVAEVGDVQGSVQIGKLAEVAPAGMVTVGGTATKELFDCRVTA